MVVPIPLSVSFSMRRTSARPPAPPDHARPSPESSASSPGAFPRLDRDVQPGARVVHRGAGPLRVLTQVPGQPNLVQSSMQDERQVARLGDHHRDRKQFPLVRLHSSGDHPHERPDLPRIAELVVVQRAQLLQRQARLHPHFQSARGDDFVVALLTDKCPVSVNSVTSTRVNSGRTTAPTSRTRFTSGHLSTPHRPLHSEAWKDAQTGLPKSSLCRLRPVSVRVLPLPLQVLLVMRGVLARTQNLMVIGPDGDRLDLLLGFGHAPQVRP